MATKVWTQERREAGALAVCVKKFGNADDVTQEEISLWAKVVHSDLCLLIELQCELTEAVELLNESYSVLRCDSECGCSTGEIGKRIGEFLQRNDPQETK